MLAVVLALPAPSVAGQLAVASEIQGALYPREPLARAAIDSEVRGWSSLDYERSLPKNIELSGDVIVYLSNQRRAVVDGEATIAWRGTDVALAAGLMRDTWGRVPDSALDPLGPATTPFSLVHPETRLAQPAIRASLFLDGASIDVYALAGERHQPVPDSDGRFGFGVATHDVVQRGGMADQALAVRVSGTQPAVDWTAHVFGGLSRRPTFVPRFTDTGLAAVDAVYTQILQAGGDLETTRADWRFLSEGFVRSGAVDVTGQERTYVSVTAAAEYQRLGAFDGRYNIIPRVDVMADSRGDRADIPFGSAVRAGMRIATTQVHALQVDMAYSFDWAFQGHAVITAVEKTLAESPTLNLGFRFTAFSAGGTPSVLAIWKDDLEVYSYLRVELSR